MSIFVLVLLLSSFISLTFALFSLIDICKLLCVYVKDICLICYIKRRFDDDDDDDDDDEFSEPGLIGRGVRHGCPLSPIQFNHRGTNPRNTTGHRSKRKAEKDSTIFRRPGNACKLRGGLAANDGWIK